jgi:hypothetical protein
MRTYYTLADYRHEMIEIECPKCGRRRRLRTERLLAKYGSETKMPDLLHAIAQCPRWGSFADGCLARYAPPSQIS